MTTTQRGTDVQSASPRLLRAAVLAAFIVFVTVAPAAQAAITVNTPADETVAGDGTCSLREAITDASFPGAPWTDCPGASANAAIIVPPGEYDLTPGHPLVFAGTTTIAIRGTGTDPSQTVINAADAANVSARGSVLRILAGANVSLSELTVTGGWTSDGASGPNSPGGSPGGSGGTGSPGGGIENFGNLTLDHAVVTGNRTGAGGDGGIGGAGEPGGAGGTGGAGGGIFNFSGTLTTTDSVIAGNSTGAGGFGGNGGDPADTGGPGGSGGAGGGIENLGTAILTRTSLTDDRTGAGGSSGGFLFGPIGGLGGNGGGIDNAGALSTEAVTVSHDSAGLGGPGGNGGNGGGMASSGLLALADTTISDDSAGSGGSATSSARPDGGGGGIGGGLFNSGSAGLANITFARDTAGSGGAGADSSSGNSSGGAGGAAGGGGAIVSFTPGSAALVAVTITQNSSGRPGPGGRGSGTGGPGPIGASAGGGAIEDGGNSLSELSTLIADNSLPMCTGSPGDGGHNLVYPRLDSSCPGAGGDPRLGPLAANGGFAETVAEQPGSAAIDAVPPGPACLPTDERGIARPAPANGMCDIGAYEVAPPVVPNASASATGNTTAVVTASITPNLQETGVRVRYGTTAGYGSTTAAQDAGSGHGAVPVSVRLTGLSPGTTYHAQLVAANADGSVSSSDLVFTTPTAGGAPTAPTAPALRQVRQSARRWLEGNHLARTSTRPRVPVGTTFSFSLDEPATVTFEFTGRVPGQRIGGRCVRPGRGHARARRCRRAVAGGTMSFAAHSGANALRFDGVLAGGLRLRPGGYTAVITAETPRGQRSAPAVLRFTIVGRVG